MTKRFLNRFGWLMAALLLAPLAACASTAAPKGEQRMALVISVESYPAQPGRLNLPHRDAGLIADALSDVGYDVAALRDPTRPQMESALADFAEALDAAAAKGEEVTAFVYFAGQGAVSLIGGKRAEILIPADTEVEGVADLLTRGVRLEDMAAQLDDTGAATVFIVVDAGRMTMSDETNPADRGYGVIRSRPGVILVHSAPFGESTPDDGAFAAALARHLREPDIYALRAFELSFRDTVIARGGPPFPTLWGVLLEDHCFNGCPKPEAVQAEDEPGAPE